jgi:hypothetical protein
MWTCQHCETQVEDKYDYCPFCELCGCLKDEHYCQQPDEEDPA